MGPQADRQLSALDFRERTCRAAVSKMNSIGYVRCHRYASAQPATLDSDRGRGRRRRRVPDQILQSGTQGRRSGRP